MSEFINADNEKDLSNYLHYAKLRLQSLDGGINTALKKDCDGSKGFSVSEIKMLSNSCRISFYMHDNALDDKGNPLKRAGDLTDIFVEKYKGSYYAYTEEEYKKAAEHQEEISNSLSKMGRLYVCGDPHNEHGIYAVTIGEKLTETPYCDKITAHRYQEFGAFDLGEKTYSFRDFCEFYQIADDEAIALFELKNKMQLHKEKREKSKYEFNNKRRVKRQTERE